jgi:hypothetical protein
MAGVLLWGIGAWCLCERGSLFRPFDEQQRARVEGLDGLP